MCKEDIRIARSAAPGRAIAIAGTVADLLIFGANANRYSISLALTTAPVAGSTGNNLLYSLVGGLKRPLCGVSYDHPADHVNIQDVGAVILGDIWLAKTDTVPASSVTISESVFITDLEDA